MFENNREVENKLHPMLICETWTNHNLDGLYTNRQLTFSQKRRLQQDGVTEEDFKSVKHLIQLSKSWSLYTGVPRTYVLTAEEYELWKKLLHITHVVIGL